MIQPAERFDHQVIAKEDWSLDPQLGLLRDNRGVELRLEPRLARLMHVLLLNFGHYVSRRDLLDAVWPDTLVAEESLTRAVSDLRKHLRANLDDPPGIETASKQGYRMLRPRESQPTKEPAILRFVKKAAVGLSFLVLLVLVLRGLNY